MAIVRKLLAHDENEDNQWLKVDHSTRYIQNHDPEWQFLFGPNSELSNSAQIIKIAAKFDDVTFDNIQMTAYLYEPQNAAIATGATCTFKIFLIQSPDWTEIEITTINGSVLPNSYFYANPTVASLAPVDFFGADSIMIEATITRLGVVYRDRVYINHLGIYDNVTRLRQDVEWLDISKLDE